ncbi:hypothetical protein ATO12_05490 [Aquimarina atlantica]|uniref:eCIS core domain-containing protein n=1 Tax=Aquimarina atlantica TaxID=1317122 RepID=A0A023BP56_9FLAO|nr:DUF4157 domain-containing protein [Aquimarina atlantica]EZH71832.1 hypothetical protein ATO12_05490 [Aquimarina atlantica]
MNKSSISHDSSSASNLHFAQRKSKENHASVSLGMQNKSDTTSDNATTFFQPKLQVNKINDPFEVEADRVADEVTESIYSGGEGFLSPVAPPALDDTGTNVQRLSFFQRKPAFESPTELDLNTANNPEVQRSAIAEAITTTTTPPPTKHQEEDIAETETGEIQRKANLSEIAEGQHTDSGFESKLHSSKGGGASMSRKTKTQMESAFGADFSNVRIHTDSNAEGMSNQVQAHAFTHGSDIYFNKGTYQPEKKEGTRLLAHELTHVVQQGAATKNSVQRSANVQVNQSAPAMVQRGVISRARNWAADKANNIPGYSMLTVILGFNPINGQDVPRNAANIFRGIMGFLPGGNLIWEALNNHGIFNKVGNWIVQQLDTLGDIGASIVSSFREFVGSLGITDIARLGSLWRRAKRIFTSPITMLINFVKGLVSDILEFIKEAILRPLASLAEGTNGWDLLIAVLGTNPITGDAVPRTAETLIGGFMKLIGQEEIWENIKKGNAIARAWAWFQGAMGQLIALVTSIPSRFINALKSLTIVDLVVVPRAFAKIALVFANFVVDFVSWAGNAMWELLKIIFSVVAPGAMPFLERAGGAIQSIFENPMAFLGNLVQAGKMGFQMFKDNIGSILRDVLIDWLTGTLAGAGVYIPTGLDFVEILKFVLSVLGLTWENMRAKLVEHLGEGPVTVLEEGFELIQLLVTEGPAAAWKKIMEHITTLKDTVIGEIISWVTQTVVTKAVAKLVSMFIPGAGFIQAILAIWGAIQVFIQRIQKIIQVGVAFMNSIADIVAGNLVPAATKVVNTMKGILVLAVSFLAEFIGLGKIGDALQNILKKIRDPIDKALDKMILWVKNKAKSFLKGKDDKEHKKIAKAAAAELKQGGGEYSTYKELRQAKMAQAQGIKQNYQGQLKEGIGINIAFTEPTKDQEDADLDFEIIIAPNTTKEKDSLPSTPKKVVGYRFGEEQPNIGSNHAAFRSFLAMKDFLDMMGGLPSESDKIYKIEGELIEDDGTADGYTIKVENWEEIKDHAWKDQSDND